MEERRQARNTKNEHKMQEDITGNKESQKQIKREKRQRDMKQDE
jgi:hypothetical protein